MSHTKIHDTLTKPVLPAKGAVEMITEVLAEQTRGANIDVEINRLLYLWHEASVGDSAPPPTPRQVSETASSLPLKIEPRHTAREEKSKQPLSKRPEGGTGNSDDYRRRLEAKRKQRMDAEKQVGENRSRESKERAAAAEARSSATKMTSKRAHHRRMQEAERHDLRALTASAEAARWQVRVATYSKAEKDLTGKLARAEEREQREIRVHQTAEFEAAREFMLRAAQEERPATRAQRDPKAEKLRVLMLGSSLEGDLRVGREQSRIRNAVQAALHRDLLDIDVRASATKRDLLQGISEFHPHVVHFSGHSGMDLLNFEDDIDDYYKGSKISLQTFKTAIRATDDPPLLVLFNSCDSASQAERLVGEEIAFGIGMTAAISDADALTYAAQFYAAVADGQSIHASHLSGQAALQSAGLSGAALPTLFVFDANAKPYLIKPSAE